MPIYTHGDSGREERRNNVNDAKNNPWNRGSSTAALWMSIFRIYTLYMLQWNFTLRQLLWYTVGSRVIMIRALWMIRGSGSPYHGLLCPLSKVKGSRTWHSASWWITNSEALRYGTCSRRISVLCAHPNVHRQSEWAIPAFAFPAIAGTHLPTPEGWTAELTWVAGYVVRQFNCPKAVTHPTTNRAQYRATALIETNALARHPGTSSALWNVCRSMSMVISQTPIHCTNITRHYIIMRPVLTRAGGYHHIGPKHNQQQQRGRGHEPTARLQRGRANSVGSYWDDCTTMDSYIIANI